MTQVSVFLWTTNKRMLDCPTVCDTCEAIGFTTETDCQIYGVQLPGGKLGATDGITSYRDCAARCSETYGCGMIQYAYTGELLY